MTSKPNLRLKTRLKKTASILALSSIGLLAACATPAPNAQLVQAHADYDAASSNPRVVSAAPGDLQRAQEALKQADAAEHDKKDAETVNHFAYLASQRIATARQSANLSSAESAAAATAADRDRLLLDARTREADQQRNQADQARQQAASANSRADQLSRQLADMNAKQTQRGLVLTLGDVLFNTGKATLNPGANHTIDQLAEFMKQNPERGVQIEGYTDSTGSSALNQSLSENRAESVKSALTDRGISADRISARGLAASNPVATNSTEAGRQQNRRVEIVISNSAAS